MSPEKTLQEMTLSEELPRESEGLTEEARDLAEVGRLDEALECFDQAIALNPANGIAYRERGHLYLALGQPEHALADLTLAVELAPQNARVLLYLGLYWLDAEEPERAITYLERSIEGLNDGRAFLGRALAYAQLGDLEKSIDDVTSAIALDGDDPCLYCTRARLYLRCHQPILATADLLKAVENRDIGPAECFDGYPALWCEGPRWWIIHHRPDMFPCY